MQSLVSSNKVLIVSQARMTSSRLPGKVLKKVGDKPLLQYHLERLLLSGFPVVLATTTNSSDDPVVDLCDKLDVPSFRGSEDDVLSRFYGAVKAHPSEVVVRVTADCPLIDGLQIARGVQEYLSKNTPWLYASNCLERTFPRGFDFEIFSKPMLEEAFLKASSPSEREHVTPYFYQNKHGKTHFLNIKSNTDFSNFRLTVDEPADFELINRLLSQFSCEKLSCDEICQVLVENPSLAKSNQHIEQKKI
jgi:spore coat polysaccharide biosynthesis protein SpsF